MLYTYARFFEYPYQGFQLNSGGYVVAIYVGNNSEQSLQLGDRLVQIDSLRWDEFKADSRKSLYSNVRPGQVVSLKIERNNQSRVISWTFPGPTLDEIVKLASSEFWLAYIFWLIGSLTLFNMRPKDERWRLMIGFNYLTAIWVTAGSISFYHIWESGIILRMAVWLCVPVYLHLNWVFPTPLSKRPWQVVWGSYMIAVAFAIAEWFQVLDPNLYFSGFLLAIGGSAVFLILHGILQPEVRRDLRLLMIAALLALLPPVVFGLVSTFGIISVSGGTAVLSLPFLPLGYLYASYRRQLGDLEVRVNRIISIYIFLILLGLILSPLIVLAASWITWSGAGIFIGLATAFFTTIASIFGFPAFQAFVEKRLLGIRLAPAQLQEIYSARITTSTSSLSLQTLIRDDILPSLLVRQFAFVQFDEHGSPKLLFSTGLDEGQLPCQADIPELIATAGKYRPLALLDGGQPCPWVRLALSLQVGDKLIGLWLFGRRDPDDTYSQLEIPTLQSLANQTAIAQSNILQTERLKALYLANIDRHEEERLGLALELHDSVLNQIAALTISLDTPMPPSFEENYEKLTQQVREIIGNLRPPMLNYGLKLAIEELAENMMDRTQDSVNVTVEIQAGDERYPQNIEQHLFRIVQEACENAIRHAKAQNIHISGRLDPREIDIKVEDDGVGFQVGEGLNLDNLLANKHFGLTGMKERAELIGAQVSIQSTPNAGTQIRVIWIGQDGNAGEYR
ncbi:MAG: ATP-binding protein [Anaerolineales bacterium]